jgi:PAS domain S-box-containing protein
LHFLCERCEGDVMETEGLAKEIPVREKVGSDYARTDALFRAIGRISPAPIYAKDIHGRFFYTNRAVLAILGKSEDDVLGRTDAELHSNSEQAAAVMANDRLIMRTGIPQILEELWDTADRGARTYRSTKAPLRLDDGSVIGVVCVSVDITSLKDKENKLAKVYATAPVGLCFVDRDLRFVMVNKRLAEINKPCLSA